jgi:hypothetical protein
MVRFLGPAKEATTVSNKPIPTGFKVWAVAQDGFIIINRIGMFLDRKINPWE